MGHTVTASEKTETIAKASVPESQKKLRSFLGLANYFRSYIPGFAKLAAPLFRLMRKDSPWVEGTPLPATASAVFEAIKKAIVSEPCMAFPSRDGKYTLQVDSAQGDEKNAGGMGAVLLQTQTDGTK